MISFFILFNFQELAGTTSETMLIEKIQKLNSVVKEN